MEKEEEKKPAPDAAAKASPDEADESLKDKAEESGEDRPTEAEPSPGGADAPDEEEKKVDSAEPEKPGEPDWKDLYARLRADFDNFKKRTARDREDTYRFAEADVIKDVLPAVDNLALALGNAKDREDDFVKGVQLVYDTFLKTLKEHGAEPFDSVGMELDPEKMEAIATLPSPEVEEGKVSNEVKRGWTHREKLLRAAQVVVSSGKANG